MTLTRLPVGYAGAHGDDLATENRCMGCGEYEFQPFPADAHEIVEPVPARRTPRTSTSSGPAAAAACRRQVYRLPGDGSLVAEDNRPHGFSVAFRHQHRPGRSSRTDEQQRGNQSPTNMHSRERSAKSRSKPQLIVIFAIAALEPVRLVSPAPAMPSLALAPRAGNKHTGR